MVSGTTSAVVWSEPNISHIEAWSSTIYAWSHHAEGRVDPDDLAKKKIRN
jgi:hypothetical protein